MLPPNSVLEIAHGLPIVMVWVNELGGVSFEIGTGAERRFIKWAPTTSPIDLDRERIRLGWAGRFISVPEVLAHGRDADGSWIVTRALTARARSTATEPYSFVLAPGRLSQFASITPICEYGRARALHNLSLMARYWTLLFLSAACSSSPPAEGDPNRNNADSVTSAPYCWVEGVTVCDVHTRAYQVGDSCECEGASGFPGVAN
jgi:hypothetical protein